MSGKGKSVETMLEELEEILSLLEDGSTPLEEAFKLYERGMKTVKTVGEKLDLVEKSIIVLEGEDHE